MLEGQIESIAFGGQGILRNEGLVIFVPFTAPQDIAHIEITTQKKHFAHGKLLSLKTASPLRIIPKCSYFGSCGGCQLQHLNYEAQLAAKQTFIRDALKRIGGIDIENIPITPTTLQWQYRRHIRLSLRPAEKSFTAGYIGQDNCSFLPIDQCPIFSSDKRLFTELQKLLCCISSEGTEEGSVRMIKTDNDRFLLAFDFSPILPNHSLSLSGPWQGILIRSQNEQKCLGDVTCFIELDGLKARFSPLGFVQNHPEQSANLYRTIAMVLPDSAQTVLDLYCGIGLTSMLFAKLGKKVIGVESHLETIDLAKENAVANHVDIQFFAGKAETLGVELLGKTHFDVVLCNPPRTGLDSTLINALLKERPAHIIYVSCMPATLARDLKKLTQGGYQIDHIQAFDMFPQTTHVETLVRLTLIR